MKAVRNKGISRLAGASRRLRRGPDTLVSHKEPSSHGCAQHERNGTANRGVSSTMLLEGRAPMPRSILCVFYAALGMVVLPVCLAQELPSTVGETLSGKPIVLVDVVRGRTAVLVAGFSREGGNGTGDWMKAIQVDPAFAKATVYSVAMLASAPGFIRGMIRSGLKKGLSSEAQDRFVVLTDDEKRWRTFFEVSTDKEPCVVLLDAQGRILWHGHGYATNLEPQVRAALH
jgi:hypothetical protein